MTDLDLTEAHKMAAALYKGLCAGAFGDIEPEAILVANLIPVIEPQIRERNIREVRSLLHRQPDGTYDGHDPHNEAIEMAAARIARGGAS